MAGVAGMVWCAAGAPVVQGVLVGLGVASTGLVFFPFEVNVTRPASGPLAQFARAAGAVRWGKRLSWLVAGLSAATIAGYVVIFVVASGRFCGAQFGPAATLLVISWAGVAVVTFALLAVSAGLRRRARRSASDREPP